MSVSLFSTASTAFNPAISNPAVLWPPSQPQPAYQPQATPNLLTAPLQQDAVPVMTVPVYIPYMVPVKVPPPEIQLALAEVANITHLPADEAYLKSLGVDILFKNGQEALNLIRQKNIQVEFADFGSGTHHAQWEHETNRILINQKYRGNLSSEVVLAISEAIYHEAGHAARLGDNHASIQEEINCLGLNTLAHRYHMAVSPAYAQSQSNSRLINDGVALYEKLFFDADPDKKALVSRIIKIYGSLPAETPDHAIPFALGCSGNNPFAVATQSVQSAQATEPFKPLAVRVLAELQNRHLAEAQQKEAEAAKPSSNTKPQPENLQTLGSEASESSETAAV